MLLGLGAWWLEGMAGHLAPGCTVCFVLCWQRGGSYGSWIVPCEDSWGQGME